MSSHDASDRRDFIKSGAATTAAAALTLATPRFAHAAASDEFKVVLIGAGGRGTGATADSLRLGPNIKLVAIADVFQDRAEMSRQLLQERFGAQIDVPDERLFAGLDAYRNALACDADLMIHGTPPGFRPLHYRAAIEAGKHVFMEKPCCVDAGGYRSLLETNKLADEKNLKVGVGLYRRHMPSYLDAMERVHNGDIGKIQFMRCYCNMTAWGGGNPHAQGMSELEHQIRNWRVFDWLGSGRLVEAHCHSLDVMDWAKRGHAVEVNGMGGRQAIRGLVAKGGRFGTDFDHHFHEYTYADGTKMYSQCRQMVNCWGPMTEHIHGALEVVDLEGKLRISQAKDKDQRSENPYRLEHRHLLDAILNDKPYNEGWIGADSSMTAIIGREASYSGGVIRWDEMVIDGPDVFPENLTWETQPPVMPDDQGRYDRLVPIPGFYKPY